MNRFYKGALLAGGLACSTLTPAMAYNFKGHELVGSVADQMLNAHARAEVGKLLTLDGMKLDLQIAAPWGDCVRSTAPDEQGNFVYKHSDLYGTPACTPFETPDGIKRMEDFVSRNWSTCTYIETKPNSQCHETFHFTDIPVQRSGYKDGDAGTNSHDVVHAINALIKVLKAPDLADPRFKAAITPFNITNKQEALLLLAHFVGDLHQPLHVGVIYLDPKGAAINPATPADVHTDIETNGANAIDDADAVDPFTGRQTNLHTEWDAPPPALGLTADAGLVKEAKAVAPTTGPMDTWATAWASESVMASHDALLGGISYVAGAKPHRWTAQIADHADYVKRKMALQEKLIAEGGARLAQILNTIWP